MILYEKYRPKIWSELIGQENLVLQVSNALKRGLVGRVFWITGASGTGKTTVARLIASEVAEPYATEEVNAIDVGLSEIRAWERNCNYKPISGPGYCFIVNEAHCLSSRVVSQLQTVLENPYVQKNSTWLFTTTFKGQRKLFDGVDDSLPFLSRAIKLQLASGGGLTLEFAMHIRNIMRAESMTEIPLHEIADRLKACDCNMREVINQIETQELVS